MSAASDNLRDCQRQLDMDGCQVGVSRQAVDEVLAELAALQSALTAAQAELVEARGDAIEKGVRIESWARKLWETEARAEKAESQLIETQRMLAAATPLLPDELAELRGAFPTVMFVHNHTPRGRDEMVSAGTIRQLLGTLADAQNREAEAQGWCESIGNYFTAEVEELKSQLTAAVAREVVLLDAVRRLLKRCFQAKGHAELRIIVHDEFEEFEWRIENLTPVASALLAELDRLRAGPGTAETAWLIERDSQWYAASPHTDFMIKQATGNLYPENWTRDANKALRFARKIDAETMIRFVGWQYAAATEHQWS